MRFLIVFYFLFLGVVCLYAQKVMPVIFPFLNLIGFSSALVPLVVILASLELGDERAPVLAIVLGLMLDLFSRYHLGTSALVLFSLSCLIVTQAGRPEAHTWVFRLIFVLVGSFAFFLLNYILILAETGRWSWPLAVWSKITFGSLLNLLLAPVVFLIVGWPPRFLGWKPDYENQERYYAR